MESFFRGGFGIMITALLWFLLQLLRFCLLVLRLLFFCTIAVLHYYSSLSYFLHIADFFSENLSLSIGSDGRFGNGPVKKNNIDRFVFTLGIPGF